jgi:hypothetical protein
VDTASSVTPMPVRHRPGGAPAGLMGVLARTFLMLYLTCRGHAAMLLAVTTGGRAGSVPIPGAPAAAGPDPLGRNPARWFGAIEAQLTAPGGKDDVTASTATF